MNIRAGSDKLDRLLQQAKSLRYPARTEPCFPIRNSGRGDNRSDAAQPEFRDPCSLAITGLLLAYSLESKVGQEYSLLPFPMPNVRLSNSTRLATSSNPLVQRYFATTTISADKMSRHPPFEEVQNGRPDFDRESSFAYTKTPQVDWKPGQGLNSLVRNFP